MKKEIEKILIKPRQDLLDLNSSLFANLASIESSILKGFRNYCNEKNFVEISVPSLTNATGACENFSTLFSLNFFGKTAYLSQTGQLYLEAFIQNLKKVFCTNRSFRKEPRTDSRHLVEFSLLEIEVSNWNLEKLKKGIEEIFYSMIKEVLKNKKLKFFNINKEWLYNLMPPYKTITYKEAIVLLNNQGNNIKFGSDLKSSHEKKLVKLNDNKPLFVTHYPQNIKFFNMRLNRKNQNLVNSLDLLMPYSGEAVGGAEREENYEILKKRFFESEMLKLMIREIKKENERFSNFGIKKLEYECFKRFKWYFDIIKKKSIKHAGCGIGLSRVVQSILKSRDIRASAVYFVNKNNLI